uniref:F-box associated domain-containing protein n=1 Tax=Fagus sylvatica TaxID=28930 RepID=A0A2N9FYE1_FAGSY
MLPQNYLDHIFLELERLVVFKGSLALIVFGTLALIVFGARHDDHICQIWVIEEYGVLESWTEKCVPVDPVENFYGCTDNGELLIEYETGLVSFDPESLNENDIDIGYTHWVGYRNNTIEGLVLLDGENASFPDGD